MLVLFDIDGTLIHTDGAGTKSLFSAATELFGRPIRTDAVFVDGNLDPLIFRDLIHSNGGDPTDRTFMARLRTRYHEILIERLATPGASRCLPGVAGLVTTLAADARVAIGLLTGNFEETGCTKLRACGLDPDAFVVNAFGDESPHDPPARHHLPPVALDRFEARFGRRPPAADVVIIGDTPNDVACARENGCRSLAVASGRYDRGALEACKPDRCLADLAATDDVLDWIFKG